MQQYKISVAMFLVYIFKPKFLLLIRLYCVSTFSNDGTHENNNLWGRTQQILVNNVYSTIIVSYGDSGFCWQQW